MRPHRRTLLRSLGLASASLSGCLGRNAGGAGTGSTDGPTVSSLRLRKMALFDAGIWGTVRVADGLFLVADVSGFSDDTYQYPLGVELDGQRVEPDDETPFRKVAVVSPEQPPTDPEQVAGHAAALAVPAQAVDRAAVVETGVFGSRWPFPESVIENLTRVPAFELRALETTVVDGTDIELTVRVANTGDRDGLWLGQVSFSAVEDASDVFAVRVPVGETVERTVRPEILSKLPEDTVTVEFRSTTEIQREVTLQDTTGTETTTDG